MANLTPIMLLALTLGVLGCTTLVSAYTCYSCSDLNGPACPNPFNPSGVGTCQGTTCGTAIAPVNGVTTYIRSCSNTYVANGCTLTTIGQDMNITACACNSDYCNAACTKDGCNIPGSAQSLWSGTKGTQAMLAVVAGLTALLMRV